MKYSNIRFSNWACLRTALTAPRWLLYAITAITALVSAAHDIEVDGIYYNINGTEATVTSGTNKYTGVVIIPPTVTNNGTSYSVTSIGNSAFYYCSNLTSVTISSSVTTIGNYAFEYCSNLSSITIPNSVTSLGKYVFNGCTALTDITIPTSVTSISDHAFAYCSSLESITIPNSVTAIEGFAFYESGITDIVIPTSVTAIGNYAFSNCSSLSSITIPESITTLDNWLFAGCSGLTNVVIPNSVTTIGYQVFSGCTSLTRIAIPNSVTSISNNAFLGCIGLTSLKIESGNPKYDSRNNCNAIIETATNTLVCGCKNTIIPNSVTSIGASAFENNSALTSVTIPNSVITIGAAAFLGSGLTSVTIPNSVTTIGPLAFRQCNSLTNVNIGNSVISIGSQAFAMCPSLSSINIPSSVTSIGNSAFSDCSSLSSINIPNSVTSIGGGAFYNTPWFDNMPDGLVYVGLVAYAYKGTMPQNTHITINEGTKSISEGAFIYRSGLTSLTIPNSVTTIGSNAFDGTTWYNNQPDGLVYAGLVAYKYKGTMPSGTSIILTNGTKGIAGRAFSGCSGLTNVTIPNLVTSIGDNAFSGCTSLTSVAIPNSVVSIGTNAFSYCQSLEEILSRIDDVSEVSMGSDIFYEVPTSSCQLKVPIGATASYRQADQWSSFNNITEAILKGDIDGDLNLDNAVNGLDLNMLVNQLLKKTVYEDPEGATDINGDGRTSGLDLNRMISIILGQ